MIFCEDLMFYFSHRTLHTPWFYKKFHKVHHEFYNTVCISSEYAHPFEFLIGNVVSPNSSH
jgi:sterol desaturase/sphingolipid hydroxylase (fatty acid hydroxylase superfamily)